MKNEKERPLPQKYIKKIILRVLETIFNQQWHSVPVMANKHYAFGSVFFTKAFTYRVHFNNV